MNIEALGQGEMLKNVLTIAQLSIFGGSVVILICAIGALFARKWLHAGKLLLSVTCLTIVAASMPECVNTLISFLIQHVPFVNQNQDLLVKAICSLGMLMISIIGVSTTLLPTIIAYRGKKSNRELVLAITMLSFFIWPCNFIALYLAFKGKPETERNYQFGAAVIG
jgi:hypothetical protein